jgi:opacity protein-like surface antigen
MKKIVFTAILAVSFLVNAASAQETNSSKHVYDIGIAFSGLNAFGMNFKTGTAHDLFRVTVLALNMQTGTGKEYRADTVYQKSTGTGIGVGLRAGYEHGFDLVKNLQFYLGGDLGISYTSNKSEQMTVTNQIWQVSPSLFVVTGIRYSIGEHFIVSAELSPAFSYIYGVEKRTGESESKTTTDTFKFGLTNGSAGLTLAYRIR